MEKRDITQDVVCYSAAISACEKGRKWEKAKELLREIEKATTQPSVHVRRVANGRKPSNSCELERGGITRNLISYSAAISA
jgi:pentatricopeptide repeat domain-containing protein 1